MVEHWNDEERCAKEVLSPLFHHSIIPVFHPSLFRHQRVIPGADVVYEDMLASGWPWRLVPSTMMPADPVAPIGNPMGKGRTRSSPS